MAKNIGMSDRQTGGSRVSSGRKKFTVKRPRADRTYTPTQLTKANTGSGMLNEVGLTAYDNGPVWTQPELQAMQQMAPNVQASIYNTTSAPYSVGQQMGQTPGGTPGTGTPGTGSQNQTNFGNEYYWNSPEFAVGKAMNNMGMSTDINSSFSNAMASLAPGLKWMSLLGSDPTGGIAQFQGNVGDWMGSGDSSGFGRLGGLNGLVQNLVGGGQGNAALEGYIDAMDPRQMLAAIGQMAQTSGYGQIAPELLQGLSGQMENIYNQFGINGGELLANLGPGQSDMDVFRDYFKQQGSGLLDYFGNFGF